MSDNTRRIPPVDPARPTPPGPQRRTGRWRGRLTWRRAGLGALVLFALTVLGLGVAYSQVDVPEPNDLVQAQTTIVYYSDGQTELGRFSAQNREPVGLDEIPEHVQDAVLAAEDRSFWENQGVSPVGMARALWNNLRGNDTQGGSTITQQYVKNYYLTQEQTYSRKIQEVVLALKIDNRLDKRQILEDYLNTIYFGRGAYGVQTAADAYFGKKVQDLSIEEGAVLAAIIRSPNRYDPAKDPANAQRLEDRFGYVVDGMVETGALDAARAEGMVIPPILEQEAANRLAGPGGHLLEAVRQEITSQLIDTGALPDGAVETGGLRVVSTFDKKAQDAAVAAVEQVPQEGRPADFHVGLAAVAPGTGEVVAMYGGADYLARQFNDATQGRSQAGSTFKPFALAAALENGISLRSRFNGDTGRRFSAYDNGRPIPNFGNASYGTIDLVRATEDSVNTVYVDLTLRVGPDKVYDAARRAGIPEGDPDFNPNPSVVLGVANVSPVQLADAFATFAAQGVQADPHVVREVKDPAGTVLYAPDGAPGRVFAEDVSADVTYALSRVVEQGSGTRARALDRPAAGKTGTTNEGKSAWFAGYTPQLATAVGLWTEGAEESLDGLGGISDVTGGRFPTMVWTAFMQGALEGTEVLPFPERADVGRAVNPQPTRTRTATPRPAPQTQAPQPTTPPPAQPPAPPQPTLPALPDVPNPRDLLPPGGDGGRGEGGGGGEGGG